MKYVKITKDDLYKKMVSLALSFNPIGGAINLVNLAHLMKTSRYQVKKYMDELKAEGMVELKSFMFPSEDELYPPYWGYLLTEKGRDTDYFREQDERESRLIQECFGI